jgi:hypothetical protein
LLLEEFVLSEVLVVVVVDDDADLLLFILNRYHPVALQISKQTLEQYQDKSNVTNTCNIIVVFSWLILYLHYYHFFAAHTIQIHRSLTSENFVPKNWFAKRDKGASNTESKMSSSLFVI